MLPNPTPATISPAMIERIHEAFDRRVTSASEILANLALARDYRVSTQPVLRTHRSPKASDS